MSVCVSVSGDRGKKKVWLKLAVGIMITCTLSKRETRFNDDLQCSLNFNLTSCVMISDSYMKLICVVVPLVGIRARRNTVLMRVDAARPVDSRGHTAEGQSGAMPGEQHA